MNIEELMRNVRKPIDLESITKIKDLSDDDKAKICKSYDYSDFGVLEKVLSEADINIDFLYKIDNMTFPFAYIDIESSVMFEVVSLQNDIGEGRYGLGLNLVQGRIEALKSHIATALEKRQLSTIFGIIDQPFKIILLNSMKNKMTEAELFESFIDIHINSENGLEGLGYEEAIAYCKLNKDRSLIEELETDEDGYVKIYRGVIHSSAPIDKSISWTTDFEVAKRFSSRFGGIKSKIYVGKIKKDDILVFVNDRGESEVLAETDNIVDIEVMFDNGDQLQIREIMTEFLADIYGQCAPQIKDSWFFNPQGIHGVLHTKRVLLLSILISSLELDINSDTYDEDVLILCFASMYHDIGRKNDEVAPNHGKRSVNKLKAEHLKLFNLPERDKIIATTIMTAHSLDDEVGLKLIMDNRAIKDKERAEKLLWILKDADNLDRVRINDLDVSYLRTTTGKRLEDIAYQLLVNIE